MTIIHLMDMMDTFIFLEIHLIGHKVKGEARWHFFFVSLCVTVQFLGEKEYGYIFFKN